MESGLDDRHRDQDGEISKKHGNTLVRTLRAMYGASFASGFAETDTLRTVLEREPTHSSLTQLRKEHVAGTLAAKVSKHS